MASFFKISFAQKATLILAYLNILKSFAPSPTMVVGDGANDLSMFKYAKTKVAFCAKEILKKEANIIIEEKNLLKIMDFI